MPDALKHLKDEMRSEREFKGQQNRGNRMRASERKSASERVSERVCFQRCLRGFSEVLRGFERFSGIF